MVLFIFLNNYIALETFIITEHHFITLSFSFVATYYPFKRAHLVPAAVRINMQITGLKNIHKQLRYTLKKNKWE